MNLNAASDVVEVPKGTSFVFLTMFIYAYPEPTLVWYRGENPIDPEDRHYDVR